MDGAGSYSAARRAGLLPTELTGMWGWILLRSPHRGRGSPQPPPPLSKGLISYHYQCLNNVAVATTIVPASCLRMYTRKSRPTQEGSLGGGGEGGGGGAG